MSTTTAHAIRDRIQTVIEALTPGSDQRTRFVRYRNEGPADFLKWSAGNAAAALRRFQVRDDGNDEPPPVSNTDVEQRRMVVVIRVAYAQDSRAGHNNALDRDDLIQSDFEQINGAIGMYGKANFTALSGFPDAVPLPYVGKTVSRSKNVDILEIRQPYLFYRANS